MFVIKCALFSGARECYIYQCHKPTAMETHYYNNSYCRSNSPDIHDNRLPWNSSRIECKYLQTSIGYSIIKRENELGEVMTMMMMMMMMTTTMTTVRKYYFTTQYFTKCLNKTLIGLQVQEIINKLVQK